MSSLNKILLIGKVASDPELRSTNDGESFAKFTLKVNRPSASGASASASDYLHIVAWRDIAKRAQEFSKDAMVYVEGRIITRTYDDENGRRHWVTEVDARDIQPLAAMDVEGPAAPDQFEAPAFGEKSPLEAPTNEAPASPVLEEKPVSTPDFDFSNAQTEPKAAEASSEDIPF